MVMLLNFQVVNVNRSARKNIATQAVVGSPNSPAVHIPITGSVIPNPLEWNIAVLAPGIRQLFAAQHIQ